MKKTISGGLKIKNISFVIFSNLFQRPLYFRKQTADLYYHCLIVPKMTKKHRKRVTWKRWEPAPEGAAVPTEEGGSDPDNGLAHPTFLWSHWTQSTFSYKVKT
jgi:hypothetical protein